MSENITPIGHAVRDELSWTHWRTILKVQDEKVRQFYIAENRGDAK